VTLANAREAFNLDAARPAVEVESACLIAIDCRFFKGREDGGGESCLLSDLASVYLKRSVSVF
jgi:hypothetical protein